MAAGNEAGDSVFRRTMRVLKIPPTAIDLEENDFPVFVPRSFAARMNP